MNNSTGNRESTSKNLEGFPVEIKQMIAKYLPIRSLVNLKMCSKGLNYNYGFSEEQILELYHNKRLFKNATAFQQYLQFKEPIGADYQFSIRNGNADILWVLLEDGRSNLSEYGNHTLLFASQNGHTDMVKTLLNDEVVDPSVTIVPLSLLPETAISK
ncbi:hypothetical protein HDV02_004074 [Globomyces sp. JEL0801]|nr:hypothetical protein HDV02_004074 [Globomyces sp. JEL0801]